MKCSYWKHFNGCFHTLVTSANKLFTWRVMDRYWMCFPCLLQLWVNLDCAALLPFLTISVIIAIHFSWQFAPWHPTIYNCFAFVTCLYSRTCRSESKGCAFATANELIIHFCEALSSLRILQLRQAQQINTRASLTHIQSQTHRHKLWVGMRKRSCNASPPLAWPFHTHCCRFLIGHTSFMSSGNISKVNGSDLTIHQWRCYGLLRTARISGPGLAPSSISLFLCCRVAKKMVRRGGAAGNEKWGWGAVYVSAHKHTKTRDRQHLAASCFIPSSFPIQCL